ncbi:hypothetical protein BBH99_12075 [Chryseobacterium contaminans]|uniref:Uncharacterized protein n=1 Tax=Chryseobacterium contaminans TaxID=1423959 RepID=A0A1M6XR23_9FLAO|nr:hypothetical protein [Chryseobacterium contaminans]OCA76840.1 hypothetical protein BBH99_12075 [Chryseobacterium contaminans]SHL08404.1 hypothetical protein SAMN05444407_102181 [Chryseobacterium contaminans]
MKKIILPIASVLLFSGFLSAQVGINTPAPKTTLDVGAKRDASGNITDNTQLLGIQAPRLTRGELTANTASYGTDQKGALIYITDISTGNTTGSRINVDTTGYYYFDGIVWQKISGGPGAVNIYTADGILRSNRIVTMADKTLSFTSAATAGSNHFSIDGATFSVDTFANRIGIGTTSPSAILNTLNAVGGSTGDVFATGINNCGADCNQNAARNMVVYNTNGTSSSAGSIDFVSSTTSTGTSASVIKGIDRNVGSNFGGLAFQTRGDASGLIDRLVIKSTGNVGVGTTDAPTEKLDINGNTRIRGLVNGSDAANFPRSVVAKADGTLGYSSLSMSSFQLIIPPHNQYTSDFNNHSNTAYDSDGWWVISKSSVAANVTFTTTGSGFSGSSSPYTTTATNITPARMTIIYEYQGTPFADPGKIYPQLTTGNNQTYPDVYNPSFIKLETIGGKTRMTVSIVRSDNMLNNWAGSFLLNTLFVVKN